MKEKEKYTSEQIEKFETSRTISDAELLKSGARYEIDGQTGEKRLIASVEQTERIHQAVEDLLAKNILSKKELKDVDFDLTFEGEEGGTGFEFEVEEEQRILVSPENIEIKEWKNHIIDVYDQSGRCRIRVKNGEPRLSLKVPLLSRDTERAKCCVRIEIKPRTKGKAAIFEKMRELILHEPGTEVHEKWGTPIKTRDGKKIWINKDDQGNYWIETDEGVSVEELLPEGVRYIGHEKSKISIDRNRAVASPIEKLSKLNIVRGNAENFETFKKLFHENLESTSRTAKGLVDASVSSKKEKPSMGKEKITEFMKQNEEEVIQYIWNSRDRAYNTSEEIKQLLNDIIGIINKNIASEPYKLREWPWRDLPAERIREEVEQFTYDLFSKLAGIERGAEKPYEVACWAELEYDRRIHPLVDGCGRVSKAISAFILLRYKHPLPDYGSRDEYYKAMNDDEDCFKNYYQGALLRSINKDYLK
ncbi:MAG: hypothetical protein A3G49_06495 [Candidatus Sungbacteria bacterium RIFCSPLOWO2_12_FULL_41_11]|uniref:Fido domain-containing protein n=1 Tax=Candidatus Sungbacteria bacterium RIFCSPLOWO2_12_FULL_41_11 TaxID=1802286 RepID=A0A1G2LUA2_9BACT|nr:MAG: hypothetical protein UV01_C0003G0077 [Parcubacteria group bacterium GW2011_GWA2_42_14]OGZ99499.1 MAG: hypothetical protein A3D41_05945 [Candidatus Sungbacteria bacterium RIFCSPHIGHO2_02_FULL_41_12b]OHA14469.1 MAG: hypothetical protein A3G49_06495 [Candidatus Sungbacteria bacterium RIFCSPLOWO2_12_FULL_41_11]